MNIVTSGNGMNRDMLSQSDVYVALVTENFVTNDRCIGEMRDADALGKIMIAMIKEGTELATDFYGYGWNLALHFKDSNDFPNCVKEMEKYLDR